MNRKTSKQQIESLIKNIREKIPNVVLRTSLIVGFPGETKDDFIELQDFIKKANFDRLGTFMYSKEDGTPAEKLPNQIHGNTKKSRYNKIMKIQNEISKQIMKKRIGTKCDVLIEDMSFDRKYYIGRTIQDAPDIDGIIYIKNIGNKNLLDQIITCEIEDISGEYDLVGKII